MIISDILSDTVPQCNRQQTELSYQWLYCTSVQ